MAMRLRTEMPAIEGVTAWVNGKVSKEEIKGEPTLVHFWSISCQMCKKSFPEIKKLQEKYPQLQIIGVHMPRSNEDLNVHEVEETINQYGLEHPQAIDNEHNVVDVFDNEFVPAFYLFDQKGILRYRSAGEKALPMLKKALARVMEKAD